MELIELEKQLATSVCDICTYIGNTPSGMNTTFTHTHIPALRLCYAIEAVLSHGLKDLHFFRKTTYWEVMMWLPNCMPNTSNILQNVKELATTGVWR